MGTPFGDRVMHLEEICKDYRNQLEGYRNELKIMFTEVKGISNWISSRFGVDLTDKSYPSSMVVLNSPLNNETIEPKYTLAHYSKKHLAHLKTRRSKTNSIFKSFKRRWRSSGSLSISSKSMNNDDSSVDNIGQAIISQDPCDTTTKAVKRDISELVILENNVSKVEDLTVNQCDLAVSSSSTNGLQIQTEKKIRLIRRTNKDPLDAIDLKGFKIKDNNDVIAETNDTNSVSTSKTMMVHRFDELRAQPFSESRRGRPKKRPEEKVQKVNTPMVCDECGKVLKGAASLRVHKQIHSNTRPFECHICKKAFRMKHHLDFHIMVHEGDKKWTCKFCNKGFLARRDLLRHERTHTGEKPFACNYPNCKKSFNVKQHLTLHFRTHTGERPYRCPVCDKTFTQANSLRIHRKIHSKENSDLGGTKAGNGSNKVVGNKVIVSNLLEFNVN